MLLKDADKNGLVAWSHRYPLLAWESGHYDSSSYIFWNLLSCTYFLDSYASWKFTIFFFFEPWLVCSCAESSIKHQEAKANPLKSGTTAFFLLQVEVDRSRASTTLKDLSSQTPYTVSVSAVYDEGESPPASAYETTRELCPVLWTHRKQYLTWLQISTSWDIPFLFFFFFI